MTISLIGSTRVRQIYFLTPYPNSLPFPPSLFQLVLKLSHLLCLISFSKLMSLDCSNCSFQSSIFFSMPDVPWLLELFFTKPHVLFNAYITLLLEFFFSKLYIFYKAYITWFFEFFLLPVTLVVASNSVSLQPFHNRLACNVCYRMHSSRSYAFHAHWTILHGFLYMRRSSSDVISCMFSLHDTLWFLVHAFFMTWCDILLCFGSFHDTLWFLVLMTSCDSWSSLCPFSDLVPCWHRGRIQGRAWIQLGRWRGRLLSGILRGCG